jgi:hypothetical protein
MDVIDKNKLIFGITEDDILMLAGEMRKRRKITPEVMNRIRYRILYAFREWDNWLKEEVISKEI